ncbi:glutamate racemase [Flavobacterium capsici]|uniref:Glutamate racemase n=1 Tax=Flavobacterium capsici TaxID=3075618 RepID=A0AA96EY62_9FLAO|nr:MULTISPECIES: glutamate racemase [unclassified Flavobacterium]WNM19320.1 glutamate racemase [Flavobacterium sp. PMR2A8]WNM20709.1 glutamate racemase [Flavobacterium sp. PMTSA4]
MTNNNPIGLFDSGIGGTSIWKEINELLPNENTIYLADSKNAPYGQKSKDEIIALSIKNTEFLLNMNCKIIVVACNTATTNAIKELRAKYDVPFIGIEPAIKPAALKSETHTIGILATKGTLSSDLFHQTAEKFHETKIIEQIGFGLVPLIENGDINSKEMNDLLKTYLNPMIEANIDYLVLGCSHYPYLIPQIKKILPKNIKIIDSGEAVARQTKNILQEKNKLKLDDKLGEVIFYTNSNPKVLQSILNGNYTILQKKF